MRPAGNWPIKKLKILKRIEMLKPQKKVIETTFFEAFFIDNLLEIMEVVSFFRKA
jgi:hypothetical protein